MQVKSAGEVLGEGAAAGEIVDSHDRWMHIDVPISRTALAFVNETLSADRLDLTLSLQGWMRVRYDIDEGQPIYNEPPGEWWFTTFGVMSMSEILVQVPRGEWFKCVLEPLGSYEYLLTEVPVLKGNASAALQPSLRHIREAERHFAEGNGPAVFQYCKGMIEALPGWPKDIFGGMVDKSKAAYLGGLGTRCEALLRPQTPHGSGWSPRRRLPGEPPGGALRAQHSESSACRDNGNRRRSVGREGDE